MNHEDYMQDPRIKRALFLIVEGKADPEATAIMDELISEGWSLSGPREYHDMIVYRVSTPAEKTRR